MDADITRAHHDGPVDEAAAARAAARGLELRRVPNEDEPAFDAWYEAVSRGFLDTERTPVQREQAREKLATTRAVGVFDASAPQPQVPVSTIASWVSELTMPGGSALTSLAVSDVTVSPTHRRRGLARTMMEGELRRAAALGLPMAMLTVTESALYGRYGYGHAVTVANLVLDLKRTGWAGPDAGGRVDYIPRERFRDLAPRVHDAARVRMPGEVPMAPGRWDDRAGVRPDADKREAQRFVQYTDAEGEVRGVAAYTVTENEADFTKSRVTVSVLVADGDDAYAGLWRFFVEMDLIAELVVGQLDPNEPVLWMLSDRRAAKMTLADHEYLRILDVPTVLASRRYSSPGRFLLDVTDPLQIAEGRFLLDVDAAGGCSVTPAAAEEQEATVVRLGIAELSAIVLGQVPPTALRAAGLVETEDVASLTRTFAWHEPARLSYWY